MTDMGSDSQKITRKNEWLEWGKSLVIALALALFIRSFLFAPFVVDGVSMLPNLKHGEKLIVNQVAYWFGEPERGDIIVFHYAHDKDYIKRVIGLPGETVEVRDDTLYINGKIVKEPYIITEKDQYQRQGMSWTEDFGPVKVPQDKLFVMGDNRPVSDDSRDIGTIEMDRVVGRADLVFWPFSSIRMLH
ncbi:MAG: signal peptidase I [Bacillaceae bacterium]|nr:signal peptidase I [Bacillaceae bacterium]